MGLIDKKTALDRMDMDGTAASPAWPPFAGCATRGLPNTERALHQAAGMAARCFQSHSRLRRFFTLNPVFGLPRTLALLDTALEDIAWLIRISTPGPECAQSSLHQWIGGKKQMDRWAAAVADWGLFRFKR